VLRCCAGWQAQRSGQACLHVPTPFAFFVHCVCQRKCGPSDRAGGSGQGRTAWAPFKRFRGRCAGRVTPPACQAGGPVRLPALRGFVAEAIAAWPLTLEVPVFLTGETVRRHVTLHTDQAISPAPGAGWRQPQDFQ